jgi:hypothetical protein
MVIVNFNFQWAMKLDMSWKFLPHTVRNSANILIDKTNDRFKANFEGAYVDKKNN